MKQTIRIVITLIPFIMLIITGLSSLCQNYNLNYYTELYPFLPDSVGYSLCTDAVFMYLYFRKSFCSETKLAVFGLLIMNLISLFFGDWQYIYLFDVWIAIVIIIISATLFIPRIIKKWFY